MRTPDSHLPLSLPEAFALACQLPGPLRVRTHHRPTGVEEEHAVPAPFVFLGRSVSAGVRLNDPSVSQCHAYLQVVEGAVLCTDLGSRNGVVWEDGTQGRGWVAPDQVLRVGAFDVRVEGADPALADDPDPAQAPARTPAAAEVHPPSGAAPVTFPLDRPITLVGRNPTCDLRLLDDSIAYFQCALVNTRDGLWFVDTMTRNGGVLNGRGTRLSRVRDGDLLELGRVSLLLQVGAHHGSRVVRPAAPPTAALDTVPPFPGAVAESVSGALAPMAEMAKQFQQCFLTMAQMLATMQREQAAQVSEQLRQIQELAAEMREMRAEDRAPAPPAAAKPAAKPRPAPRPRPPGGPTPGGPAAANGANGKPGAEPPPLFDAHEWFLDRLAKKPPPDAG
jgi:pSer/pThr/pTyr-binding forkhead associated (FHA) protein